MMTSQAAGKAKTTRRRGGKKKSDGAAAAASAATAIPEVSPAAGETPSEETAGNEEKGNA